MKTQIEIESKLKQIMNDERLALKPANVFVNAPLALIQTSLESQMGILQWILEENKQPSEKT